MRAPQLLMRFRKAVHMRFEEQVALVTGAASGIGLACALELARGGADIAVVDIVSENALIETAHVLKEAGTRVATFSADVTDYGKAERVTAEIRVRLGGIDILVNSAGINSDAPVWELGESHWDRVVNTNLKGTFNYIHAVSRLFREQCSGKIVNISSIEALRGRF